MSIIVQGTSVTTRLVSSSSTRQPRSLLSTSLAHSPTRSLFLIVIYTFVVNAPLAFACTMGSTKGRHLLPSRSPSRIPDISVSWPSLPSAVHLAALVAGQCIAKTDHGHRPIHIHGACSILFTLTLFRSPNFASARRTSQSQAIPFKHAPSIMTTSLSTRSSLRPHTVQPIVVPHLDDSTFRLFDKAITQAERMVCRVHSLSHLSRSQMDVFIAH